MLARAELRKLLGLTDGKRRPGLHRYRNDAIAQQAHGVFSCFYMGKT
jgi:hypothetical protein